MPETVAEVGLFAVDHASRRVRGVLVPWGVRSRESVSRTRPITFRRGDVRVPRDISVVGLNVDHNRFAPIGRAVVLEDRDDGLFAEFEVARTDEGDAWLADHGEFAALSAELTDIRRRPDDSGTAYVVGAGVVPEGAFEGTGLFAALEDEQPEAPDASPEEDTDAAPAEPDDEPADEPDENEEDAMPEAVAPATMLASRGRTAATPTLTKAGFMTALRSARTHGEVAGLKPYLEAVEASGLFALNDIKFDGSGGLVTGAGMPNAWLGELWQGRRFQRRVVPLITAGVLTSLKANGWIWNVKPTMAEWGGNKANVPSNAPTVTPKEFAAQRFAGGHDLAREYFDFGVTEVIDSYVDAMVDSYAILSDGYALTQIKAGATAFTPGAATENTELLAVIDGALAVVAAQATPSFAIVAPDVFRGIVATPHNEALEYFDAAVGLEDGRAAGFRIVPDARLAAGDVIVGAREAATAWELPGVPIRVSAPDLVKGGIDEAFFGYIAAGVTYPAAVVKANITPTP